LICKDSVIRPSNITDNGTVLSGSKTYNDLDLINAKVKDGDNLLIQSEISPSGKSTPVYPLNVASAVQAAVTALLPPPSPRTAQQQFTPLPPPTLMQIQP
jgi:hypothetical protein